MRVLLIGTSTHPDWHTSIFNLSYELGFKTIGCDVVSISHREAATHTETGYDLILLSDTTIDPDVIFQLAQSAKKLAVLTHAEFCQGPRDVPFLQRLDPDIIFLDQPLGGVILKEVKVPQIFLGYGAHDNAWRAEEKDIDVAWVGHGYPARQQEIVNNVWPLKDRPGLNVKIHGYRQPDGTLGVQEMLDVYARSKIAIHIGGPIATDEGGYGGQRIYNALASGCLVVSTWSPLCEHYFPVGVFFCNRNAVLDTVDFVLEHGIERYQRDIAAAYHWMRNSQMVSHKAAAMLEAVGL